MMERFEVHWPPSPEHNVFEQKLHDEIIHFKNCVKDILNEMKPIKEQII